MSTHVPVLHQLMCGSTMLASTHVRVSQSCIKSCVALLCLYQLLCGSSKVASTHVWVSYVCINSCVGFPRLHQRKFGSPMFASTHVRFPYSCINTVAIFASTHLGCQMFCTPRPFQTQMLKVAAAIGCPFLGLTFWSCPTVCVSEVSYRPARPNIPKA